MVLQIDTAIRLSTLHSLSALLLYEYARISAFNNFKLLCQ